MSQYQMESLGFLLSLFLSGLQLVQRVNCLELEKTDEAENHVTMVSSIFFFWRG